MKPKVFVVQPIPEAALDVLRQVADVSVYPYMDRTGRGRIIDEPELIRALQEKRIAGAALDVYWNEPYMNDPPGMHASWVPEELRKLDNVILAPHNGNATWDTRGPKCVAVAKGMVAMMRGERPATLMNPEIYASA